MYQKKVKPLLDFVLSLIGIIFITPVLIFITTIVAIKSQGNPFFIQPRIGKHKKVFHIIKFRTMNNKTNAQGKPLPDIMRLTTIGKFLRNTSLDELPQLINVLLGDMSLVGPRPLLTDYVHVYNEFQDRRHEVKPGITGWVQVNGRNSLSWDERFKMDVWYVENMSFYTDFKIILKTIQKVIKRDGINAADTATIEPFNGND